MLCMVVEVSLEAEVAMALTVVEAIQVVVGMEIHRVKPGRNFLLGSYVAELIMRCSSVTSGLILHS
jgi:hypothetical protein